MSDRTSTKGLPEEEVDVLVAEDEQFPFSLVVWNDEVNTFDWVIASLMEVCGHTHEQAEQCALIIHFNGKYAVKQGEYLKLRPLCEALQERGLSVTIEEMAGS
ncbi:ATP-dependent Clp protease adaptor protein ClpS [Chitinophaga ginsengisegetis]|jgi:ATP-dependent Clp protease adaptor protein ClpS|uniref:ATP-dependent Clp protease adaptor protein ClpS n=1 Tax=Chitinophaga ginsengisegetis TaxID=393003 RepID=A0A1T5NJ07_9BACT|nr:ATP-dependent Clp protease adaptor ClpS [Chitinophaga ginsengisegetis]MDR6569751.1 ATP-dependent Clp protease adaptor protein ClpS [Chitinophaga ginsengisegetis]MDR6649484.1 ATP-dependent Clp protease adaptor protein ClpS [Chitinophaga ginsengisegetis]MDR6655834.1 ATP-dependent Clp protease adaptor protein ClpS [Chitinophaga ginsengisegetis]SKD00337.1 ATP-dependent Clp protease adaptor protein ClpS [Chitinophaga ginsengisegetis]